MRRATAVIAVALALIAIGAPPALAAEVHIECGLVTAFRAVGSNGDGSGSVVVGTFSLGIAPGAQVPAVEPGAKVCLTGPIDAHGQFLSFVVSPIPATMCGDLADAVANGPALQRLVTTNGTASFHLPAGRSGPAAGTSGCFVLNLDTSGVVFLTGPSSGATTAPSTLPNTSSAPSSPSSDLPVIPLLAVALIALAVILRVFGSRARRSHD